MKKIIFIVFSLLAVFLVAGCATTTTSTQKTTETPSTTNKGGDQTTIATNEESLYPVIRGAEDTTIQLGDRYVPTKGLTAFDRNGNDITDFIEYSNESNVNPNVPGVYDAVFVVTDEWGLTTTVRIKVTVESSDKDGALLSGVGNSTVAICSTFDPLSGVKADDIVDGDITDKIVVTGSVDTKHLGEYTLNYSVTDEAGNETKATRVVTVSTGKFIFADEDKKTTTTVTADLEAIMGAYPFGVIKVEYTAEANATVTLKLEGYEVTYTHEEAGTYSGYVRYDAAIENKELTVTGATFVSYIPGGCPDNVPPTLTGEFEQTFVVSKAHPELAAQFVCEMSEAVAKDDTDGFITDKCYLDLEGFSWESTDVQNAKLCVKDAADNLTTVDIKVMVANETFLADMLPYADSTDTDQAGNHNDGNPTILMYRNMLLSKDTDESVLIHGMTSEGGYPSYNMIKYDLSNLSYGNTYVLKLTAKFSPTEDTTQATQSVGYRIGQSLGDTPWYIEFDGFSYDYFNLTREYQTSYHIFKYTVEKDATSAGEAMEFQFGNSNYNTKHNVNIMCFEIYILSNENQAPVLKRNAELPTIFVKDSEAPDLSKYFTAFDVEDENPEVTITGSVDMTKKGVYTVTYKVVDSEGLSAEASIDFEVLNEADTIAPVIEYVGEPLPEEILINTYTTDQVKNFFMQNLKITDQKDGETINIPVKNASINWGNLSMEKVGKYTVRVKATDDSGNSTEVSFTIRVKKEQSQGGSEELVADYMTQKTFTQENVIAEVKDGVFEIVPTTFTGGGWASFNKSKMDLLYNFVEGMKYKFVVEAKADAARTMAFSFACTDWTNYGSVGKIQAELSTEYEKFEVEFVYTGKFTTNEVEYTVAYTALEIQVGNINSDAGETTENKVYIKSMQLFEVTEGESSNEEEVADYMTQETFTQEKVTAEFKDGVFEIVPTEEVGGWASANKSKMELLYTFVEGKKYKFVVEAKADVARTMSFSFAATDSNYSKFGSAGIIQAELSTEYEKFEVEFVYTGKFTADDVEYAIGYCALEIQLGHITYGDTESLENKVYIKTMKLYEVTEPAKYDVLANGKYYSDGNAVTSTKNEDGSFDVSTVNAKYFGWNGFTVPAGMKYFVFTLTTEGCNISYKVDADGNPYNGKQVNANFADTTTIVIDLADITANPTELIKFVLWSYSTTGTIVTVTEAYFTDTFPED